jgi:hypothetical protein
VDTRRTLVGALAAPLLLLSACGGDDSIADPPVSSAPTSSDPTSPPQRESAEHFIRRFYAAERAMENSGKTSSYMAMTQGCSSCKSLTKQVKRFYRDGGFVRWAGFKVTSISGNNQNKPGQSFDVAGIAAPTTYKTSSGGETQHLSGGRTTDLVTLTKTATSWRVTGFAKLGGQ